MGTRGLLGLIIGTRRRASYNHYDSDPLVLGQKIVQFLLKLNVDERRLMASRVRDITWVDEKVQAPPEQQTQYSALGFSDEAVAGQTLSDWYCLLRNVQGAAALPAIENGTLKHMIDSTDFAKDSLFCEWAYFVDFEQNVLETWRGFQTEPTKGNPFGEERRKGEDKYYPIKLMATVQFDDLDEGYMGCLVDKVMNEEEGQEEGEESLN